MAILVLGSGRSGTSEVAEILQDLGVDMGSRFHIGDKFNPRGYFEDRDFQELNMMFVVLGLPDRDNEEALKIWRDRLDKHIKTKKEPWGVKDPGIADFPNLLAEYLKYKPNVIVCTRDKADAVNSFKRFKNLSQTEAEHIYENRLKNIKDAVQDYLEVDCYEKDKLGKIKSWLTIKNVL